LRKEHPAALWNERANDFFDPPGPPIVGRISSEHALNPARQIRDPRFDCT
jgi:hypothetical protein